MKISVCIATYNGEKYLKEQIISILNQLSLTDEIVISDDGSKDDTLTIIDSIGDSRIKVFVNNERHGVTGNFANALQHAQGDIIFLSDQDDIWTSDKVKTVVDALTDCDCVLHNAQLIDADGQLIENDLFTIYKTRTGYINNLIRNTYVGCCMAFRKELLEKVLPIPSKIKMHDMWIALIAERTAKTKLINKKLIFYRRHENNASTTSNKSKYSRYFQLEYRLQMLYYSFFLTYKTKHR
jgi:Glycosyltransferases involved in cell wall biogenesis